MYLVSQKMKGYITNYLQNFGNWMIEMKIKVMGGIWTISAYQNLFFYSFHMTYFRFYKKSNQSRDSNIFPQINERQMQILARRRRARVRMLIAGCNGARLMLHIFASEKICFVEK